MLNSVLGWQQYFEKMACYMNHIIRQTAWICELVKSNELRKWATENDGKENFKAKQVGHRIV